MPSIATPVEKVEELPIQHINLKQQYCKKLVHNSGKNVPDLG